MSAIFPKKRTPQVFAFLMSAVMAFLMTAVITVINTGVHGDLPHRRLRAFEFSWPIAFGIVLLTGSRVRSLAERLCAR